MNKFSIIMPVYNSSKFLASAIESVLGQTYKNFELIIIDDKSEDNSIYIAESYAKRDSRIKIIKAEHKGVSNSRNIGIEVSENPYILFMDSDDTWEPNLLELSNDFLLNNINTELVIFGISHDFYNGDRFQYSITDFNEKSLHMNSIISFDELLFKTFNMASPCNKIYRRKIILDKRISFNTNCVALEDLIFNLNYLMNIHSFRVISLNLYHYKNYLNTSLTEKRKFIFPFINSELLYDTIYKFNAEKKLSENLILNNICFDLFILEARYWLKEMNLLIVIKKLNASDKFYDLLCKRGGLKSLALKICMKFKLYRLEYYLILRKKKYE